MNVVYAKSNTSIANEHGVIFRLEGGQAWAADDPIVKAHPDAFSDSPTKAGTSVGWVDTASVVETATAEPGKKRRSGRG